MMSDSRDIGDKLHLRRNRLVAAAITVAWFPTVGAWTYRIIGFGGSAAMFVIVLPVAVLFGVVAVERLAGD